MPSFMPIKVIMLAQIPLLNQNYKPLLTITLKKEEPKPTEQLYTIKDKDTLTSISEATGSSVERLWAKNPSLTNPDIINPGASLTIPQKDEALADRAMPVIVDKQYTSSGLHELVSPPSGGFSSSARVSAPKGSSTGNLAGNSYSAGQCVWAVKNWIPWVRNGWGNASSWGPSAEAEGFNVSKTPVMGSVAWETRSAGGLGHVAMVIGIGSSTVTVREMNWAGLYQITERTTPISDWQYIYP